MSAQHKIGRQTAKIEDVKIISSAAIVGKKEGEGPLSDSFDIVLPDNEWNEKTWEKTESKLQREAVKLAAKKINLDLEDIDRVFSGDLLNQCISAGYGLRELSIPFFGIYGACSTMIEGISLASMLLCGGFAERAAAVTSSHFCTAERQYRFPLEYGSQRPPTAQWTVTGAGSAVVTADERLPTLCRATHVTLGRIVDMDIKDANNMGAAMAPAAADTLRRHMEDTARTPADYDLIITGDLGRVGHDLLVTLLQERGMPLNTDKYIDCGLEIFSPTQDTHAGGSGCGCSAVTLCGHIMRRFREGELRRVLFMATGALLSTTSSQQGDTIPGVAHAIVLEADS